MVLDTPEGEVHRIIPQRVCSEAVLLLTDPGQGQSRSKMDTGRGQSAIVQLHTDGSQGENIEVIVQHFGGNRFLVSFANGIKLVVVDQKIMLEGRFMVRDSSFDS